MFKTARNTELLSDQVYQELKLKILNGVYQGGDQLSANDLAEEYQISVTPIRDALNALHREGLVEILPRVGYFVTHMTLKDIHDIFDLRLILEGASAELAAKNITEVELQYLEQIPSGYVVGDQDSYVQYVSDNREFHYRIAMATRNIWLAQSIAKLLDQMQRLVFMGVDFKLYSDDIIHHHPNLLAALRRRDGDEARRVMVEGLEITKRAVLESAVKSANLPIRPSA